MMRRIHDWLLQRWYSDRPAWILIPFTWLFVALSGFRRALYRSGILLPGALSAPVIVVGNLSVGGSGKTPCTLWLCQVFRNAGYRPGIVTRGYGGRSGESRIVTAKSDPRDVGDEAVLLARRSGVPVAAGRDRLADAQLLIDECSANLILSDDGLQHYRLPRNAEIVMLDGSRGLGNGWRLPAGPLRESAARLQRAELVVVKSNGSRSSDVPPDALSMRLELIEAVSLSSGERKSVAEFAGQRVHAVAGIADPGQFFQALENSGIEVDRRALPDHAIPTAKDLDFGDTLPVLMTEKDAVKCHNMQLHNCWYIPAEARFSDDDKQTLLAVLNRHLMKPHDFSTGEQ